VVTAPDAIVYINGEPELLACNNCRRRFDINKFITSVQVDLNVDNAPGSASINLSVPRHTVDDFMVEGEPIVSPMMEIEIWAKGYYLVEGLPQYYPIFWGLVTEVSDSYSGGEHTFSINCADILKWWEYCKMNVNPAYGQPAGQLGHDYVTGNVFHGANVYDIIWTLAQQSFGDIVRVTGSLTSAIMEQKQKETFTRSMSDIVSYWNTRFGKIRSNLVMYGIQGAAVRGDTLYETQPRGNAELSSKFASQAIKMANGGENNSQVLFDPESVNPFRSDIAKAGQPNLWQSEYQTKLEIANACKEAVGFEFYMDVTGDIVFKPPMYNLDILSNKPLSWIQDIDIIDWDFSSSEAEVVTHLSMQGSYEGGAMALGMTADYNTPFTQVIDYHLLRKFGWRTHSYSSEGLNNTFSMFYMGLDILDRLNAKRHRASINIPLRPELRLGFPLYIAPKDQIWYTQGISHNIQMGGRAQTTLTLTAKREKFIAPRGIGSLELTGFTKAKKGETPPPLADGVNASNADLKTAFFKLKVGDAAEIPQTNLPETSVVDNPYAPLILRHPKTGRIVGYPNVVMAYTRPYAPDDRTLKKNTGQNTSKERKVEKVEDNEATKAAQAHLKLTLERHTQTPERDLADKHLNNRYIYGLTTAGVYTYVHDTKKVIKEFTLIPASNIEVSTVGGALPTTNPDKTAILRPVSDERGFELIGHYRYGRGVSLSDGALVISENSANQKASVEAQLALSGGMFESLTAQAQGLTALSSNFPNPADAVSKLAPDGTDLQTAATINPDTGKVQIISGESNFIDTATLNSPKNQGFSVSVEASQLSRALTLAEMRVKESFASNEECSCLLGRADLAFINSGYQVAIFSKGTVPDTTDMSSTQGGTGTARNNAEIARLQAAIQEQRDLKASGPTVADLQFDQYTTEISSLEAQLAEIQDFQTSLGSDATEYTAVSPKLATPSGAELISKVEAFLVNLYEVLDTPHQQFEKELRGNFLPGRTREEILNGEPSPPPLGDFSPPYSAGNRARGGDPAALALQGSSALGGMAQAWKNFGDDLKSKPQQVILTGEIDALNAKLKALDEEEATLKAAKETKSTIINPLVLSDGISRDKRLKDIEAERQKTERKRDDTQGRLNILNNESR
jgi:hypothetical protein